MNALTRREFLRTSALISAATIAAACTPGTPGPQPANAVPTQAPAAQPPTQLAPPTAEATAPEPAAAAPAYRFGEAPTLAGRVAAGELPPVDDRLPLEPCVLANMDGTIGKYGGTIRRGMTGLADSAAATKMVHESLLFYDPDLNIVPRVASSWETSEDGSEFTFHLREGMRWSDGEPFDAESIRYWYDMDLTNETLTPAINARWKAGGALMELAYPDAYTVTVRFADANPLFVYTASQYAVWSPGQYLAQFHGDLVEDVDALMATVTEAGFDTWDQYYWDRATSFVNPDLPQLGSWISKTTMADELYVMERNPYCFQVDPEGQQLPYIDRMHHRRFDTPDVFNLWILNGEIDFQHRHVALANYTLFREGAEAGEYHIEFGSNDMTMVFFMNQTCPNASLRAFFQNRDVRIALSHAIDRDLINDLVYDGLGTPRQYSPSEASPQFCEALSNAYLEYDPDLANEMLDAAGYAERSPDGFRVHPDGSGEEVSFILESFQPNYSDVYEIVTQQLAAVGIKVTYSLVERSLNYEHVAANTLESGLSDTSRAVLPLADPAFFLNISGHKHFGIAWCHYYLDPTQTTAEAPPEGHYLYRMWDLWDEIRRTADLDRQNAMFREILDIWIEELPMIGILGEFPEPFIVRNGLHAFPSGFRMALSNTLQHEGLIPSQTYYWDEPEQHA